MAKSSRSSLQLVQWHLDLTIQNLDVAMMFDQSSLCLLCQTCFEAAVHDPSFAARRLGFRVFCVFADVFLLFRQTGTGRQGRKGLHNKDNRHPCIFKVQEWFEKPFTRYLVAPVQFEPHSQIGTDCYVGSTILRLHKMQDTRIRKLRQLLLMEPVHAEPMLHWQVSRKQFSLVVLPVTQMGTQRHIRILEMALIQRWNPSLNFSFILKKRISKVGPDYSFATKQLASFYQAPGTRLHRELRKRLHKLGALSLYSSSKQETEPSWMILTILSKRSLASFNLQRMLRSSAFSLHHIYAAHRLSNNLDEPPRSMAQGLLQKILVFKGGVKPPKSRPLQIPFVSPRIQRNHQNLAETSCHFKKGLLSSVSPSSLQRRSCCSPFVGQIPGQPS